jgi:hypothetical protein
MLRDWLSFAHTDVGQIGMLKHGLVSRGASCSIWAKSDLVFVFIYITLDTIKSQK